MNYKQELADLKTRMYKEITEHGRITEDTLIDLPFHKADGPFTYTILSRTTHEGFPEFNRHTLAESAHSLQAALAYAARRHREGYWVDIYKELAYATPDYPADD